MLNFLTSNIINIILLYSLYQTIYSISGVETFDFNNSEPKVDINNICPCDINVGICDQGCICDKDCLDLMLSYQYFKLNSIDESSYTNKNIDSKLDYCDDYQESLDDLYNPLVLAFKILKRGFCLVKKKDRNEINSDKAKNNNNENENENKDNKINYSETNSMDINSTDDNFIETGLFTPIALPSGHCLFHAHQIRKNIDYAVTCSYHRDYNVSIVNEFLGDNTTDFYIRENYYNTDKNDTSQSLYYIKKVEIIFYNEPKTNAENNISLCDYKINRYYSSNSDNDIFFDLTVEVKFLNNSKDFKKSGNYGYIKGKPIIIVKENNTYLNGAVFPLEINTENDIYNNNSQSYIYYDNYIDNRITFEDLILYGYNNNANAISKFREIFKNIYITQCGNGSNISSPIEYTSNKDFCILGKYKDSGAVNNTQYKIEEFNYCNDNNHEEFNKYFYFIIKFIKLDTKTKWWYAPGPGVVRVPKNIMYPFKIGND